MKTIISSKYWIIALEKLCFIETGFRVFNNHYLFENWLYLVPVETLQTLQKGLEEGKIVDEIFTRVQ